MNGSRSGAWARFLPAVALAVLAGAATCWAGSLTTGVMTFSTTNQSVWRAGVTNGVTIPLFNVSNQSDPFDTNFSASNEQNTAICVFGGCFNTGTWGYSLSANLNGYVGATSALTLTGGSVNATVPVNVTLGFPNTAAVGTAFSITSSGEFEPGASLSTTSPGLSLSASLYANLNGGISAQACAGVCTAPLNVNINTNGSQVPIPLFNQSLDPSLSIPLPDGVGTVDVSQPFPETQSAVTLQPQSVATPLTLTSQGTGSDAVAITANVSQILATALGFPYLSQDVELGGVNFGYTLFSATVGQGLSTVQNFTLTPTPEVGYSLDFIANNGAITNVIESEPVGTPLTVTIPSGDSAVEVTPTYTMYAPFVNQTGAEPNFDFGLNALGLSLGPLATANLVSSDFLLPTAPPIYLPSDQFNLGNWNVYQGQSFEIMASSTSAPEPRAALLLAAGLLLLLAGLWSRRRHGGSVASQRG